MKVIVFAPHPDDEIFGCGGSILKWMDEGHEVHIVYVTDNRALIKWGIRENQLLYEEAKEYVNLGEYKVAEIALKEAVEVSKSFGFLECNTHFYKFHDQKAMNNIEFGTSLSKDIIRDSDRIVMPSDKNNHPDHQATHTMVKKAAQELNLDSAEFYIYALYNVLKIPKNKQVRIRTEQYRNRLYELMKGYKTQLCLKDTRMGWEWVLKRKRIFKLEDMNSCENF